jgi:hypothetical protein
VTLHVSLTARAELQLFTNALWWAENRSTEQASLWLDEFQRELQSQSKDPEKWPIAPESEVFPFVARQMAYGLTHKKTDRAIFEVRGEEIIVHAIQHLAQDELSSDEV